MRLSVVKGALVPADDDTRQRLNKIAKIGDSISVVEINERNQAFNNKVFATLQELAEMLGTDPKTMRAEIAYGTGYGWDITLPDGKSITMLDSMSRYSMTQRELEDFWAAARTYILAEVMIRLDADQQKRVLEMLGATRDDERRAVNPLAGG
jgi:hypothetical protein